MVTTSATQMGESGASPPKCGSCLPWIAFAIGGVLLAVASFAAFVYVFIKRKSVSKPKGGCAPVPHTTFAVMDVTTDVDALLATTTMHTEPNKKAAYRQGEYVYPARALLELEFVEEVVKAPLDAEVVEVSTKWNGNVVQAPRWCAVFEGLLVIPTKLTDVTITSLPVDDAYVLYIDEKIALSYMSASRANVPYKPDDVTLRSLSVGPHTFSLRYVDGGGTHKIGDITLKGVSTAGVEMSYLLTDLMHMPFDSVAEIPLQQL